MVTLGDSKYINITAKHACKVNTREDPCQWTPDIYFELKETFVAINLNTKCVELPSKVIWNTTSDLCNPKKRKKISVIEKFYVSFIKQLTNFKNICPVEKVSYKIIKLYWIFIIKSFQGVYFSKSVDTTHYAMLLNVLHGKYELTFTYRIRVRSNVETTAKLIVNAEIIEIDWF